MDPERWARVRELFDLAIDRTSDERETLLREQCEGDPELYAEVVSLLAAHEQPDARIEQPLFIAAAHLLVDQPVDPLAGRQIGPYVVRHELGRGGMGVVYLADDTRLSRRVALKALAPEVSHDVRRRERLRREARAAAALSHVNIATVYALETIDDQLYLACEYISGQTLRAVLASGSLPLPEVLDIARQLAAAMAAAHAQGVVHRDLKPENIIRTAAGVVKVLDFGVARVDAASDHLTREHDLLGTAGYMAPEQIRGHDVTFRSDLFAFGVLVYELASGSNPFSAATRSATIARILEIDPTPLSDLCGAAAGPLGAIVATCLSKDPANRYRSTSDLVTALNQASSGELSHATSAAAPDSTTTVLRSIWWWQFHQAVTSAVYILLMYPVWRARVWLPAPWSILFVLAALTCAATSTTLRLHLWFTSRVLPLELGAERRRSRRWTRLCEASLAGLLLVTALWIGSDHQSIAMLFVTVAIATFLAAFVIEPTTARAAFSD